MYSRDPATFFADDFEKLSCLMYDARKSGLLDVLPPEVAIFQRKASSPTLDQEHGAFTTLRSDVPDLDRTLFRSRVNGWTTEMANWKVPVAAHDTASFYLSRGLRQKT